MKSWFSFYRYLTFCLIITGCSGYQLRNNENPLAQYGISKLAMPIFLNRSSLPQVTGPVSREFIELFNTFPGLTVYQSENARADALLLGIITSDRDLRGGVKANSDQRQFVESRDIGNRRRFLIPAQSVLILKLRLVLIKDPNFFDKKVLLSKLGNYINAHPKVIFDKTIDLNQSYNRSILGKVDSPLDGGGIVNFTNNKGSEKIMISLAAKKAVKNFKELVLNAF